MNDEPYSFDIKFEIPPKMWGKVLTLTYPETMQQKDVDSLVTELSKACNRVLRFYPYTSMQAFNVKREEFNLSDEQLIRGIWLGIFFHISADLPIKFQNKDEQLGFRIQEASKAIESFGQKPITPGEAQTLAHTQAKIHAESGRLKWTNDEKLR